MKPQRRREWILRRLGAPSCGLCGRVSTDIAIRAVPSAFAKRFGVQTSDRFYAAHMCGTCLQRGRAWQDAEIERERRRFEYEQTQRDIKTHMQLQEARSTRLDYVRACAAMQDEVREALTGWDMGTPL